MLSRLLAKLLSYLAIVLRFPVKKTLCLPAKLLHSPKKLCVSNRIFPPHLIFFSTIMMAYVQGATVSIHFLLWEIDFQQ